MKRKAIYFFIGTTAELIRIAPILKELKNREYPYKLITTGQNKVRFQDLDPYLGSIQADIAFKDKSNKSSVFKFLLWSMTTFFTALFQLRNEFKGLNKQNSYFVIYGDPVSTSMGALIARIYGLKIIHLESGDFSGNLLEPFPEEICRHINVRLADVLFPPGEWALNNLKNLNKPKINTFLNTQVEPFLWALNQEASEVNIQKLKKYYILILHRQEHVLLKKDWSKEALETIINNAPKELNCVLFNHPLTVSIIESINIDPEIKKNNIKLTPLVSYSDFLKLVKNSEFIATDGATNQYEAYLMGKPCLILRDHTEQVEGLNKNVILYKSDKSVAINFLNNYTKFKAKPVNTRKRPSKIIVDYLLNN